LPESAEWFKTRSAPVEVRFVVPRTHDVPLSIDVHTFASTMEPES
jgi:hypothetical protein